MRIVSVNTLGSGGGAAWFARRIAELLRSRGHEVVMIVGRSDTLDANMHEVPVPLFDTVIGRMLTRLMANVRRQPVTDSLVRQQTRRLLHGLEWKSWLRKWQGREDFELGGSRRAFAHLPWVPDIVHLHNLHTFLGGTHFDLRILPELARHSRLVFTLQDPWLTSGHCAHSFACERWRTGCGECPDLRSVPAIRRDRTAENLQIKAEIYRSMRYTVVGCCQWILDRARASVLGVGLTPDSRVINNGIDLEFFRPAADRTAARAACGLGESERAIAFISDLGRESTFRDYGFVERLARVHGLRPGAQPLVVFEVGGAKSERRVGAVRFIGTGFVSREAVRDLLRASDVLLHPARADTYPTVVLEAMACGVPVLGTRVGGIPEQVVDGVDGFLVESGDADTANARLQQLLALGPGGGAVGAAARQHAVAAFGEATMIDAYEALFTRLTASPV